MHGYFSSKARTLELLTGRLTASVVPLLVRFSYGQWKQNATECHERIQEAFTGRTVIVRSSARDEDSSSGSMAGKFLSVAHVPSSDLEQLTSAIDQVFGSYGTVRTDDEVFVQEQVSQIAMCGVIFTRDIDTHAPYYVVNYDESSSHNSVTSGSCSELRTFICVRDPACEPEDGRLRHLLRACREVEVLVNSDSLDIEFAFDTQGTLFILQVRPLATVAKKSPTMDQELFVKYLHKISKKLLKLDQRHPGVCGARGMYSVMTDWNPAEMIGIRPRMLALSLYKYLITDRTWAYQRDNYGYRNLRGVPLLISLMGLPYIDVRASLTSFVPADVHENLAEKLVNYYMQALAQSPTDHDKVEFNIVFSCYDLDTPRKLALLENKGFSGLEIDRLKQALLHLTNRIIDPRTSPCPKDEEKVRGLRARCDAVLTSNLATIDRIYILLEDCCRYGTLPFAGLARAAFIGVQLLHSLVATGIFSSADRDRFLASLNTVARQMSSDLSRYNRGEMPREAFLAKYGHLRPGTYDIMSLRYDEAFDRYFSPTEMVSGSACSPKPFELSQEQVAQLDTQLAANGITVTPHELMVFIKRSIEGREFGKFEFSRSVSCILSLVRGLGERVSLSTEDLSHLDIHQIARLYASLTEEDVGEVLARDIAQNRKLHEVSSSIRLPQLIRSPQEAFSFFLSDVQPNYVSRGSVTSVVVVEEDLSRVDLTNKIIFIRSADPGYDWLFSKGIGGLVTMYGGANSHMAIRCSELKIPAVIGCGEQNFSLWSRSAHLEIDCAAQQVRVL